MATAALARRTSTAYGTPDSASQDASTPRPASCAAALGWPAGAPAGARELLPLLDLAGVALVLIDPNGRRVASTSAFDRLLDPGPGRLLLWNTARRLVEELHAVPLRVRYDRATALTAEREVTTPDGQRYRVAAAVPHPGTTVAPDEDGWAAVTVRLASARPGGAEGLAPDAGLTARERQVADLLAQGHTTAATANALGLSPHTIRHHAERVYEKLGVRTRALLAARLAQLTLLATEPRAPEPAPNLPARTRRR